VVTASYIFGGYLLSAVNPGAQSVQTALAVVVQREALNLPAEQEVQGVQVVSPAEAAKVPVAHWVHAAEVCMPVPVLNVPARQLVHGPVVLSDWHAPKLPAAHGFGHARMIMGELVSPRNAYKAAISVAVRALW
jgi:hypothetical protein